MSSQPAPEPSRSTQTNHCVMVVDDDQDIREILAEALSDAGYRVVTAKNGAEALEILTNVKPSLILLDLNMPIMDGIAFRHAQRLDPAVARVPTVVMSAVHRMRERIADLAVDDALEKPITLKQLFDVVERYCR
jgi:CheY-like chemotaxis protein